MAIMKDKRGFTTLGLIAMILLGFFLVVGLGVLVYGMTMVDNSMSSIDGTLNNISINDTYQETLGLGIDSMKEEVPQIISTGTLLGMVLCLLIIGFKAPKKDNLWIIMDIGVIICAEVLAFIVSGSFTAFINSSPEMLAVFRDVLPNASKWILSLPAILPIIGGLIMLATYFTTKEKEAEEIAGF